MPLQLSIKQKQVLGVTAFVAVVVVALSALHVVRLAGVLLEESRARAELLSALVFDQAGQALQAAGAATRGEAYEALRRDPSLRSTLRAATLGESVAYAAIVDPAGTVVAHGDPMQVGVRLPPAGDFAALLDRGGLAKLLSIYEEARTFEWRQQMELGGEPFGEIRIGVSTLLIRTELDDALGPALLAAAVAFGVSVLVALLLSHVVLRPIHVIRSGLTRLGRGDLGATLDLRDEEFRDIGDVFDRVTAQLKAAAPEGVKRAQLAELSRRVVAVGRLTAGVAHEVKNPLNAMTIHLELLKQKLSVADAAGASTHAETIAREIRRLDDVVQGFLKFVRPEELTISTVPAGALIEEVARSVQAEAGAAGVSVEVAGADTAPAIEADRTMLRQALYNVAQNAVQAMPNGGRLRLVAGPERDGRLEIRVEDTGIGIQPENLARIFDLYFTTRERGTGIGLSLVFRAVQLHNGDIDVESTPGAGTSFVLKLPIAR
ncbi:MAG: ATP-binding protein [Vicinamibacterales bacterium]